MKSINLKLSEYDLRMIKAFIGSEKGWNCEWYSEYKSLDESSEGSYMEAKRRIKIPTKYLIDFKIILQSLRIRVQKAIDQLKEDEVKNEENN